MPIPPSASRASHITVRTCASHASHITVRTCAPRGSHSTLWKPFSDISQELISDSESISADSTSRHGFALPSERKTLQSSSSLVHLPDCPTRLRSQPALLGETSSHTETANGERSDALESTPSPTLEIQPSSNSASSRDESLNQEHNGIIENIVKKKGAYTERSRWRKFLSKLTFL